MSGILFIISAPSGSGKSTLVDMLRKQVAGLDFSISYTTRQPRGSEQPGREYHFVSRETFEQMIERGEFLEFAEVFGNYYGTAHPFPQADKDLLLDIDVQGARQVRAKIPDSVSIFVLPPNKEELEKRLRRRNQADQVDDAVIQRRLVGAAKEIENYRDYDYILVNDDLQKSLEQLEAIVLMERQRRSGKPPSREDLRQAACADGCRQSHSEERLRPILESFDLAGKVRH